MKIMSLKHKGIFQILGQLIKQVEQIAQSHNTCQTT